MANATIADIQASLQSGYYGLVNLALASLAYVSSGNTANMAQAFKNAFNQLDPLPTPQSGNIIPADATWTIEWGPATTGANANLSYVARFGKSDLTYLRVVGLRGTDTSAPKVGLLEQLIEDLNAFKQTDWMETLAELSLTSNLNPFARKVAAGFSIEVANGSTEALELLLTAQVVDNGVGSGNLIQHLHGLTDLNDVPLLVTGHSLGGALTQVVSAYLAWQIGGAFTQAHDLVKEPVLDNIFPNAFAPPTAGTTDFANRFDHIFPYNYFWYNASDIVPHAYQYKDVATIKDLWGTYPDPDSSTRKGQPCPATLVTAINTLLPKLPTNYARPSRHLIGFTADYLGDSQQMQAFLDDVGMDTLDPASWEAQLIWQHFPLCYYQNIKTLHAVTPADYPLYLPPAPGPLQ